MADVEEQGERNGLSRRDMIKAAGIAGAAAWTAPVIVDSLASPAAAASGNTGINCSKSLVFFTIPGSSTVYISGFQDNGCQTCGCFGTFSDSNIGATCPPNPAPCCPHACFTCGTRTFRLNGGSGTDAGTTTACDGGTFTAATPMNFNQCDTYLSYGGGTVTGINGATILGAIGFGGNQLNGYCPSNNQITNLGACNTLGGGNAAVTTSGVCP
jgi:hypothetical protein